MKSISNSTTLNFKWWRTDEAEIFESSLESLSEAAWEFINEQIGLGMREGNLLHEIEGVDYQGYWKNLSAQTEELVEGEFEYLQSKGNKCANKACTSTDITASTPDIDGGTCTVKNECAECGSSWEDAYSLRGFTELVVG